MNEDDNYKIEDDNSSDGWLATYSDLVTLLLCFFVLLYSMSTIDEQKMRETIESLNKMGILTQQGDISETGSNLSEQDDNEELKIVNLESKQMDNLYGELQDYVKENNLKEYVDVENQEGGVLIRFKDDILYDTGKAELKSEAKSKLLTLSTILKKYNNEIKVEGHTDNIPIKNNRYESNWELSASRAINVVNFFSNEIPKGKQIPQNRFQVSGYGEYRPIVSNDSEQNRQKNRRIEIFVIKNEEKPKK